MPRPMTPRPNKALLEWQRRLPAGELLLDRAARESRAGDKWLATRLPDAVALPRSTRSVAVILRFAQRRNLPVTPRGAGQGYVGGCVPSRGGIVLSLARMDRIRDNGAISRTVNGHLKRKERASRDARMAKLIGAGKFPYTPPVQSWISTKLDKPFTQVTEAEAKALAAK